MAIVIRYRAVLAPDVGDLVPAGHGSAPNLVLKVIKFGCLAERFLPNIYRLREVLGVCAPTRIQH